MIALNLVATAVAHRDVIPQQLPLVRAELTGERHGTKLGVFIMLGARYLLAVVHVSPHFPNVALV